MNSLKNATDSKISVDQLIGDDKMLNEVVCKICCVHVVGCGPKLTKCSHLFCGDCLQQWFDTHSYSQMCVQQSKVGGVAPCPVCEMSLRQEHDVFPIERNGNATCSFLSRMIQGLRIKCNANGGCCSWKGGYRSFFEHIQRDDCGAVERAPSPSTCSGTSSGDCSLEDYSTDEEFEGHLFSSMSVQSQSHGLASLIKDLIDLEIEEPTSASWDPTTIYNPDSELYGKRDEENLMMIDYADIEPSYKAVVKHVTFSNEEPMIIEYEINAPSSETVAKPFASSRIMAKGNCSNKQQHRPDYATRGTQKMRLSPQQQQAYEWEVARYRMAYSQQYHMVVQAVRMPQCYQQAWLVAAGSI